MWIQAQIKNQVINSDHLKKIKVFPDGGNIVSIDEDGRATILGLYYGKDSVQKAFEKLVYALYNDATFFEMPSDEEVSHYE